MTKATPTALPSAEDALREAWQPIETAPEVEGKYFFCRIAWGPDWDKCTGDGFRWSGRWFVAATFHKASVGFSECQTEFRQIEVDPTHWMPKPAAPTQATLQSPRASDEVLGEAGGALLAAARAVANSALRANSDAWVVEGPPMEALNAALSASPVPVDASGVGEHSDRVAVDTLSDAMKECRRVRDETRFSADVPEGERQALRNGADACWHMLNGMQGEILKRYATRLPVLLSHTAPVADAQAGEGGK